jgi:hypothetical protein
MQGKEMGLTTEEEKKTSSSRIRKEHKSGRKTKVGCLGKMVLVHQKATKNNYGDVQISLTPANQVARGNNGNILTI